MDLTSNNLSLLSSSASASLSSSSINVVQQGNDSSANHSTASAPAAILSPGVHGWQDGQSIYDRHRKLLLKEHMSDITFLVGEEKQRIPAHKFILASSSPVFEAMFTGSFAESGKKKELEVPDIEPEGFIAMLSWAYCEQSEVKEDHIYSTLRAASKYWYPTLITVVTDRVLRLLNAKNALKIFEQTFLFEIAELDKCFVDLVQSSTRRLLKDDSFTQIQKHTLKFILSQPKLNVSERELFDACVKWARAECGRLNDTRPNVDVEPIQLRDTLGDLIYLLRIFSFDLIDFMNGPCESKLFTNDEMLEIIFHLAHKDNLMRNFVHKFDSFPRLLSVNKWIYINTGHSPMQMMGNTSLCNFSLATQFTFSKLSYLHELYIQQKAPCLGTGAITVFIRNNTETVHIEDTINNEAQGYKFTFDFPIIIKPSIMYISVLGKCLCTHYKPTIYNSLSFETSANGMVKCDFIGERIPNCIAHIGLSLY